MVDIRYCTPNNVYIIVERVYAMLSGAKPGPSLRKVVRHVSQVCADYEVRYEGKRIDGIVGGWQLLMDALGLAKITQHPTGKKRLLLVYLGADNLVRALNKEFGDYLPLPKAIFKEHTLNAFGPYTFGSDPIPSQRLFNNPSVPFVTQGGSAPPVAMAVYHGGTGTLEVITPAKLKVLLR